MRQRTCLENTQYKNWLAREYVKAEETHGVLADAGYGQTVSTGQQVTLDGFSSSAETGGALTYDWTQVGGPEVLIVEPARGGADLHDDRAPDRPHFRADGHERRRAEPARPGEGAGAVGRPDADRRGRAGLDGRLPPRW